VPDYSTVIGVPGRVVGGAESDPLAHGNLPDPEGQAIDELSRRVAELEAIIKDSGVRALSDEKNSVKR
jgi:serine O-acetyltransferase